MAIFISLTMPSWYITPKYMTFDLIALILLVVSYLFKYIQYCILLYSTIQQIWDMNLREPYRFW